MRHNTVCWMNCGTSQEVAMLVEDIATISVRKLPARNPFPPGRLYRAFEIAKVAALLALGDDIEFRFEAERWLTVPMATRYLA